MKYQQLKNLECGWKWKYLMKKHREGERISRYQENSMNQQYVEILMSLENKPEDILLWIDEHMAADLDNKMKQTIRARRKRYYNAELKHTRKKSIDLDFWVWQRLSQLSERNAKTLSEMITYLIEEAERKEIYENQMKQLKQGIKDILN